MQKLSKHGLDMDAIAKRLEGNRRGTVKVGGGYFGAMQLAADVQARFQIPARGGRASDPEFSEQRLIRLRPETLRSLETLAQAVSRGGKRVGPLQLASLLLEKSVVVLMSAGEMVPDTEPDEPSKLEVDIEGLSKPRT